MASPGPHTAVADAGPAAAGAPLRWHVAGLAAGGVAFLASLLAGGDAGWLSEAALVGAVVPAAAGLVLLSVVGAAPAIVILWAFGGLAAAWLTGGVAGPGAAWCVAALAAALTLRDRRSIALGAAASLAVAGLLALLQALGEGAPAAAEWRLAALLQIGLAAGLAYAVWLGLRPAPAAPDGGARIARLLAAQPNLFVSLTPAGRVIAQFGGMPRGLDAASLSELGLLWSVGDPKARPGVEQALEAAHLEGEGEAAFAPTGDPQGWIVLHLRRTADRRLLGVLRDAAGEHRREVELEAQRDAAEAQNAGKSRFLANMSHELRTPLNAIMGFSDVMKAKLFGPLPPKYAEYAELIHESGRHLLDLINDILDVSKIEADRYELALEAFDAREAVTSVLRLARVQADQAGVALRGVLPRDAIEVTADRRALKQMVLNLVGNALKFTPRGGSVTLTARADRGQLEVAVADTGVGIAQEDIARLGRPYEQAGDADQKAGGTGLGLSLVRALAGLHGGELLLESALGEGTVAIIRMPVVEDAASAAA